MDQTHPGTMAKPARARSVDVVKGIAIILMVFGHTEQGALHRHLWDALPQTVLIIKFLDGFIYGFHMPAFFFVAGLFVSGSAKRRGTFGFILEKSKTILYPYILWLFLGALLEPLTARYQVHAHAFSWRSFADGVVTGNVSWFLITLFLCQLLALVTLRFPHWIQMCLALTACFLVPVSSITTLYEPFVYFPFLVAGMWFSANRLQLLERIPAIVAWTGFVILFVAQVFTIYLLGPVTRWNKLPIAMVGISMLILLSLALRQTVAEKVLAWYGEGSLAIFLMSPFFQGIGREFVTRALHTNNPLPYLGFTTLFAASLPPAIWFAQHHLRAGWLFRWPEPKRRCLPAKPQPVAG